MSEGGEGGVAEAPTERVTRCGYVALIGPPNVGKSTLLNAMVGEKLAAVTSKAQTTWRGLRGLRTVGCTQMILMDTPGLLKESHLLHRALSRGVERAIEEADVIALVVDPSRPEGARRPELLRSVLAGVGKAVIGVVNKVDAAPSRRVTEEESWLLEQFQGPVVKVSARSGSGLEELLERLELELPRGPFLYPSDELATDPTRVFVVELIREVIFEQFDQEIPYSVMPVIEEFRSESERTYIGVMLHVERESQKGILVGRGGGAIRRLGTEARGRIEGFLGTSVYLDLWVKVLGNWRKKAKEVRRFGFELPQGAGEK